jgi:hypothetical protein
LVPGIPSNVPSEIAADNWLGPDNCQTQPVNIVHPYCIFVLLGFSQTCLPVCTKFSAKPRPFTATVRIRCDFRSTRYNAQKKGAIQHRC